MTAKYLFVTMEGGGNLPPVLGAAKRMLDRGHDVRVVGEPCIGSAIEDVGARFVPFTRHFVRQSRSEEMFYDWQASSPPAALKGTLERVVLGPAAHVVADVKDELDREPADALVVDWLLPGAIMVGEARGLPTAVLFHCVSMIPAPGRPPGPFAPARGPLGRLRDRLLWGMFKRLVGSFGAEYNRVRQAEALPPLAHPLDQYLRADRLLYQTTEAFDFAASPDVENAVYVGPVLDEPDWIADATWESPFAPDDTRPLVLLSLSSTFQDQKAVLQTAIDALGRLDVRALVTLGPAMAEELLTCADNVRLVSSAPHSLVFPHVSVFISHCGHGSLMRALAAGVPIVALPMGRDQDANATRLVTRGIAARPRKTAKRIAQAVTQILEDDSYREAAMAMREHVLADVRADRLSDELAALTAHRSVVARAAE
jgi:MGT family glycosyltransferase